MSVSVKFRGNESTVKGIVTNFKIIVTNKSAVISL